MKESIIPSALSYMHKLEYMDPYVYICDRLNETSLVHTSKFVTLVFLLLS